MYENEKRLIDEAISEEPIKNTFRLGWEFITLNKTFTMTILSVLLGMSLLGMLPIIGFIFLLLPGVLSLIVQIYAGRLVYETKNIETFVSEINEAKGENIVQRYFAPAIGAYAGWLLLGFIFMVIFSLLIGSVGNLESSLNNNDTLITLLSTVAMPILVVFLLISYVQPLIQANVIMADTFQEGFLAVMTLFSRTVWAKAFQSRYFNYMALFGLVLFLAVFLFGFLFAFLGAIPILNMIVMSVFMYLAMIIMSVSAVVARRIVE